MMEARVKKFFEYLNFDWKGEKRWKEYQLRHEEPTDKEGQEAFKRKFYSEVVDPEFDKSFMFQSEEERLEYVSQAQFYGNLGILGGTQPIKSEQCGVYKDCAYLAFLIVLPLYFPFKRMLYFTAILFAVYERHGGIKLSSRFLAKIFLEEEVLNVCIVALSIFVKTSVEFILMICLTIWAVLSVAERGHKMLIDNPQAIGLAALRPLIERIRNRKVEFVKIKNHIELGVGVFSIFLWLGGAAAPLFPIFFLQYLRVKYLISFFMKHSCHTFDSISAELLPGFVYSATVNRLKPLLAYFVNYEQQQPGEPPASS